MRKSAHVLSAEASLTEIESLREEVRDVRRAHWFPLTVFGVVTLLSLPFYWRYGIGGQSCGAHAATSCTAQISSGALPGVLDPGSSLNDLSSWLTVYWVVAFGVGYGLSVWHYHKVTMRVGVRSRIGLSVSIGVVLLLVVCLANTLLEAFSPQPVIVADLWIRGTASLVILGVFFVAMAIIERSAAYVAYSTVFLGLAIAVSLYDLSNLMDRAGLSGLFNGAGVDLPNLLVPAAYLLIGGLVFWLRQRGRPRLRNTHEVGMNVE